MVAEVDARHMDFHGKPLFVSCNRNLELSSYYIPGEFLGFPFFITLFNWACRCKVSMSDIYPILLMSLTGALLD